MTESEPKNLTKGQRVYFGRSDKEKGRVTAVHTLGKNGPGYVVITWDDGYKGTIDHRDMKDVHLSND